MVINRGDMKRKRKQDNCINLLDHSPKRTKVHAQRKFAQGSNVSSPVITPIKEIETQERKDMLPEPIELLPVRRPNTEDFLTFLCFRGTPILPHNLNFFNNATMVNSPPEDRKETRNGPIMTAPVGKNPNDRPFVAFGVRKRADPVVISKQMDKKRRHALALQALRRKYQEQKMAKIRAIAISKVSEKTTSKSVVRTRSICKTETVTKKDISHKTKVKVVSTKRIARHTIKQPIRTNINPNIKSKMCLRSFRGRYVHRELQIRSNKAGKQPNPRKKDRKVKDGGTKVEDEEVSSEFSSDDDEPLVKKPKLKIKPNIKLLKKPLENKTETSNVRLTRSQKLNSKTFKTVITKRSTISTRLTNKKLIQQSVLKNRRTVETIRNTVERKINVQNLKDLEKKSVKNKEKLTEINDIKTRSKSDKSTTARKPEVIDRPQKYTKIIENKKEKVEPKKISKNEPVPKALEKTKPSVFKSEEKTKKNTKILLKRLIHKSKIVPAARTTLKFKNVRRKILSEESIPKLQNVTRHSKKKSILIKEEKVIPEKTKTKVEKIKEKITRTKENVEKLREKGENPKGTLEKLKKKVEKTKQKVEKPKEKAEKTRDRLEKPRENVEKLKEKLEKPKERGDRLKEKIEKSRDKVENPGEKSKENSENPREKAETSKEKMEILKEKVDKPKEKTEKGKSEATRNDAQNVGHKSLPKLEDWKSGLSRPSRKTKEAATLYMELLGHRLVNDGDFDDDNISIDSFPELPNVRKTEQRENELKAKVCRKDDKILPKGKNIEKKLENEKNSDNKIEKEGNKQRKKESEEKEIRTAKKNQNMEIEVGNKIEGEISAGPIESQPKKIDDKKIESSKAKIDRKFQIKNEEKSKSSPIKFLRTDDKNKIEPKESRSKESENDSLNESDTSSNIVTKTKKKSKMFKKKPKFDQSFSDSDEEPLSNFAKPKDRVVEANKTEIDISKQEGGLYKGKPKRECTKRPQNYLPLYSSSDEEKFFHGFLKSETKPVKEIKVEEKCTHSVPSLDLSCKDVSRRFGKGKVNMSNEQIEKWLNDSAMAGMNLKKEEEDLIKYGEKPTRMPKSEISKIHENKPNQPQDAPSTSSQTPEKSSPLQSVKSNERKMIFKKTLEPIKNINAFSANNESSVYAFEAEEDSSISTPFRRPSRRPSSTATSKSEDDASKHDDLSKGSGRFRLPIMMKSDQKTPNKLECAVALTAEESNNSFAAQVLDPTFTDNSNSECQMDTEDNEQCVHSSLQTGNANSSKLLNDTSHRIKCQSSVISKCDDRSSIMFPPANALQKPKVDNKTYIKHCVQSGKGCDRNSETSEDFKYKIPSSPSASSSSSAKLYKRPAVKNRKVEVCNPVNSTEFPGDNMPAQIVEAPVYHPTDKEFQDPLEYIEKIRPKAERFGICRIVPPATFKPECKVSDDMRFTAYNQYVNKMLHRWGPNFKELMAIKKYLQTQNISLAHPPWIGGMEVDLPRLYQTVQTLGGLKEVIEKKKWPKVSDGMKIPKSAQDRVTKLDDIYCKYLLPYDTLSPAEREKLLDEVETEWAKKESKVLSKIKEPEEATKAEVASTESESELDDEADECIMKGRNMALNAFYRIARNTMSMWFKSTEPSAQEVEQEFWKHVTLKNSHICVHSGSIDSGNWGYGFAVSKNSPFARHAWNLKVLTNNSGSALRYMGPIMGVTVPTLHVGMVFSGCCWYRDPHSLPWIEYLHTGAHKIWYGIPNTMSEKFHQTLLKIVPNYCRNKSIWLPSDTVMLPPNLLVENGVSLCRTVQEPGHFVVVFPKVFTSTLSTGYIVSESVYFAPSYWLETAQDVFDELRRNCEPSMFSLDRLLLSITMDQRSSIDVLKQIIPDVQKICNQEKELRTKLRDMGLTSVEKLPIPESPAVRKRKKLQSDGGDYECEICRKNLFVSLVAESQEDVVYCLEHAVENIEKGQMEAKNCKLMFTYSFEELEGMVEKINKTIEAKLHRKIVGKSLSMVLCK